MAKFIVTHEAEQDIDDILVYIANDNFEAAMALYERFVDIFNILADNPLAGRERNELRDGWRSFPIGNYLIFYRSWAGNIAITRILHRSRDLDEILT